MIGYATLLLVSSLATVAADGQEVFDSFTGTALGGVWSTVVDGEHIEHTYQRSSDGQFVYLTAKGGRVPVSAMIGVDPATSKCTWWVFRGDGGVVVFTMVQEAEDVWLCEGEGRAPQGTIHWKFRLIRLDDNTTVEEGIEIQEFGEPLPPIKVTWTRKRAAEEPAGADRPGEDEEATAEDYLAFWKNYFLGDWNTRVVEGREEGPLRVGSSGTWSFRASPTGACMILSATDQGEQYHHGIGGYDPVTRAWKEVFFMRDGARLVQWYSAPREALLGDPVGTVVRGTAKYVHPDGRIEDSEIRFTCIHHDRCEYVVTHHDVDGEAQPGLTIIADRRKE